MMVSIKTDYRILNPHRFTEAENQVNPLNLGLLGKKGCETKLSGVLRSRKKKKESASH